MSIAYCGGGGGGKGRGVRRRQGVFSTLRNLSWKKAKLEAPLSQNVAAGFTIVKKIEVEGLIRAT